MSFQESAESLQSRLHLGKMRPSVFMAVLLLAGVAIAACAFGVVQLVSAHSFSVESAAAQEGTGEEADAAGPVASDAAFEEALICVHVSGCVKSPGVYELAEGRRVADAIEKAGGALDDANLDSINLARVPQDGEQIHVPSREAAGQVGATGGASAASPSGEAGPININTATVEELTKLDGVGEATAEKIVAERTKNGPFSSVEDIKRVSGIGDKKFEALKDDICV